MSPRAQAHLESLKARLERKFPLRPEAAYAIASEAVLEAADQAIQDRQEKQRRTAREVEIRDTLVTLMRELVDHYSMQRPFAVKASIQQGQRLVEELDELHALALGVPVMVREVA